MTAWLPRCPTHNQISYPVPSPLTKERRTMTKPLKSAAAAATASADLTDFDPAPVKPRHDGWTAERQRAFIAALAEQGCVSDACRAVGVSPRSAYRLRRR